MKITVHDKKWGGSKGDDITICFMGETEAECNALDVVFGQGVCVETPKIFCTSEPDSPPIGYLGGHESARWVVIDLKVWNAYERPAPPEYVEE